MSKIKTLFVTLINIIGLVNDNINAVAKNHHYLVNKHQNLIL
jgi:hypothetical protein